MYRVMIVEDEIPIRHIIVKIIDWESLGFDLVYQADNGKMALEYIEDYPVDLVITDISMPFMDGLELCKYIYKHRPDTTMVILSGHSEFDYAQKAISLGVTNYILKPVTRVSFTETLSKIRKEMDLRFEARKNLEFLRKQYYKSKNLLKNKYLNNLLMGYYNRQFAGQTEVIDVALDAQEYIVATLLLEESMVPEESLWGKDRPLFEFALLNLAGELLLDAKQDIVFLGPGNQICMLLKIYDDLNESVQQIYLCLERITRQIHELFGVDVTIGVSDPVKSLDDLNIAYKESLTALEYRVLEGSEKVIVKSNMEGKTSFTVKRLEEQLTRLIYSIKVGDNPSIRKIITYIFSVISYEQVEIDSFRTFLMEMIITIYKTYNEINKDLHDELLDYKTFNKLFEIRDFREIQQFFLDLCADFSKKIAKLRENEDQNHVNEAIDYIQQHYTDPLLTVESLSKVLYLSAGHFSRLFKKNTGLTFVDYLTKIRMDQAKYLLSNSGQKMYEISRNIGYEDPNYFSYNFKKHTGLTPSEWRKKDKN